MGDNVRELTRTKLTKVIARDKVGRTLTPEAQQRAANHATTLMRKGYTFSQLKDIGIKHVTEGILKDDS